VCIGGKPYHRRVQCIEKKVPAPVIAAAAGASMKVYARASGTAIDPTMLHMVVGLAIALASGLIALAAVASLVAARTTLNPLNPGNATRLVTGGVFRISRNPLYLSLLLLLVAYAVRLAAPALWLGPIVFVAYVTRFQIHPEERALKENFGEAYQRYRMRTRRWL
jgi:protein-S-isoprenylcysteine O-methyltransferase Ste14